MYARRTTACRFRLTAAAEPVEEKSSFFYEPLLAIKELSSGMRLSLLRGEEEMKRMGRRFRSERAPISIRELA
jgi:hypothetical protein